MSYPGSVPPGEPYDGQQPRPNSQYPHYGNAGPPSYAYPHMQQPGPGYIPTQQPFPPIQQVQYPLNNLPPVPLHEAGYNYHATFAPPAQYVQPTYPLVVPPPMPSYQASPTTQPMPPPRPQPQRPSTTSSSPKSAQSRRVSSQGAIQKPERDPRKSLSSTPTTKSPTVAPRSLADPSSLLICIADECLTKAHSAAQRVASSPGADSVQAYHKLINTGLGCLDAALQTGKLSPRTEVLVRLRYGSLLCEETENIMEAETCLNSAIILCEKARPTVFVNQYLEANASTSTASRISSCIRSTFS